MKKYLFLIICLVFTTNLFAQNTKEEKTSEKTQTVEAACGQCQFGLKGKGCSLAVRMNGKAYFVDGTSIDEHGDAHAPDGFCNSVRKAEVKGKVVKKRFKSSSFKLIKEKATT